MLEQFDTVNLLTVWKILFCFMYSFSFEKMRLLTKNYNEIGSYLFLVEAKQQIFREKDQKPNNVRVFTKYLTLEYTKEV